MAKLPGFKRFDRADFPELPHADKLLAGLNKFMDDVYSALGGNLTLADNTATQIHTFETVAPPVYPIKIKATVKRQIVGVWPVKAVEVSGSPVALASVPQVDWSLDADQVKINSISGLTNGKKYSITVIMTAG